VHVHVHVDSQAGNRRVRASSVAHSRYTRAKQRTLLVG